MARARVVASPRLTSFNSSRVAMAQHPKVWVPNQQSVQAEASQALESHLSQASPSRMSKYTFELVFLLVSWPLTAESRLICLRVKKITGMKKAMTKTMTEALSIPAFTFSDEMDATALIMLRKEMKKVHTNLTMLPFFIKACSIAMTEFPVINSHIDNDLDSEGYI